MKKILIIALCVIMCLPLFGCEADSYKAFLSIESGTKESWSQKHDFLEGTKGHTLNLGKEPQEMVIEVVTEEGSVDIVAKDKNGEIITEIIDAETVQNMKLSDLSAHVRESIANALQSK